MTILFVAACGDNVNETELINGFIESENITTSTTDSGLQYVIQQEGTGDHPDENNVVSVYYVGYFTDREVFDSGSTNFDLNPNVSGLIDGFVEAITLLKRGGRGTFILPSRIAYGSTGGGSIPANTPIIFEIELVDFN